MVSVGCHECGWCARWRELAAAYDEGRRDEATLEALRTVMHEERAAVICPTGVFVRGQWRQQGEYLPEEVRK